MGQIKNIKLHIVTDIKTMQSIRRLVSLASPISTQLFRSVTRYPAPTPVIQKQFLTVTSLSNIKASQLTEENLPPCVGCPICSRGISFGVNDVLLLSQFMTPEGGLFPMRITGLLPRTPPNDGGEPPVRRLQSRSQVKKTLRSNVFTVPATRKKFFYR